MPLGGLPDLADDARTRAVETLPTAADLAVSHQLIAAAGPTSHEIARAAADQVRTLLGYSAAIAIREEPGSFRVLGAAGSLAEGLEGRIVQRIDDLMSTVRAAGGVLHITALPQASPGMLLVVTDEHSELTGMVPDLLADFALVTGLTMNLRRTEAERDLELDQRQTAGALTGIGHLRWVAATDAMHWSAELYAMTGVDTSTIPSWELWEARMHPEDRASSALIGRFATAPEPITQSFRWRHPDGAWRDLLLWCRPVHADGVLQAIVGAVLDQTAQRAAESEVARMASRDTLTGLVNRRFLDELTQAAISALPPLAEPDEVFGLADLGIKLSVDRRDDEVLSLTPMTALLLIDLDRFKLVNDSLGHATGDELLVVLAERLTNSLEVSPVNDCAPTVARVGGDEFVVLLPWVASAAAAHDVATWLLDQIRQPVLIPGREPMVCTGSIGVSVTSNPQQSSGDLLREADLALYHAKDGGRNRATLFDVQLKAHVEIRMQVEQRLRSAMDQGRLVAVYQPIVSMTDDRMIAVEALVRMREEDGSLSHPDAFISVAEESGLIVDLDQWMLEQAVQALGEWQQRNVGALGVQVNVSARTLSRAGFEAFVMNLLARHRVDPTDLRLELTEAALVPGGSPAQDTMRRLAGLGVRSGIDDFGTGYSSLAYLQELPVSFLKVDRMFVSRLDGSHRANAVVRAVIELAHAHGYSVTAEGVETAKQAEILREMGCDDAQGWLFGRPQLWQPPSPQAQLADLSHPSGVGVHHW